MSNRAIAIAVAAVALFAGAGFALGALTAPTEEEAGEERSEAQAEAYEEAYDAALAEASGRGSDAGEKVGRNAGRQTGAAAGQSAGTDEVGAELAAAEAAERARNCGAPLFPDDVCPTDEEISAENQAESLCGSGQYEEAAAQGIDCGPGTSPRP